MYQIGRGKTNDLAMLVDKTKAERIIFDNNLTPVQSYNLAKITGIIVIDRFQLILEIFSIRASTYEAELLRHQKSLEEIGEEAASSENVDLVINNLIDQTLLQQAAAAAGFPCPR